MSQLNFTEIVEKTKKYLRHQSELFGDDLVLNNPGVLETNCISGTGITLDALREIIRDCQKCSLAKTRTHFVFGAGNPEANLMLVGEAPGREEDLQGEPFVGKAGQLLDRILAAIEFQRGEVYIGNILKCRPPDNRDPSPEEIALCIPYLMKQLDIIRPKIILALGRVAAQALLRTKASLTRLRDEDLDFQGIPVLVTYHPAALLRNPHWKKFVWDDVQRLRTFYDKIIGDKPKWQPPKK